MPQLIESAKDALSQFGSALVEYAPSIGESAAKIVSYLASAVIENLPQIIEVGKQIVQGFITGIEQEFPGLGAFLSGLFDGFASTLAPIAQTVVDALSSIFSALDGADPETMEALGKAIGTIAASIAALKVASEVVGGVKMPPECTWWFWKNCQKHHRHSTESGRGISVIIRRSRNIQ